jgi:hypothetical protein
MKINILTADDTIIGTLPASQQALDFLQSVAWIPGVKFNVEIVPETAATNLTNPFGGFIPKRGDMLRLTGTGKVSVTSGQIEALMQLTTLARSDAREVLNDVCNDDERTITLRPTVSIDQARKALDIQDVYSSAIH